VEEFRERLAQAEQTNRKAAERMVNLRNAAARIWDAVTRRQPVTGEPVKWKQVATRLASMVDESTR
jgi:hypothetical protein